MLDQVEGRRKRPDLGGPAPKVCEVLHPLKRRQPKHSLLTGGFDDCSIFYSGSFLTKLKHKAERWGNSRQRKISQSVRWQEGESIENALRRFKPKVQGRKTCHPTRMAGPCNYKGVLIVRKRNRRRPARSAFPSQSRYPSPEQCSGRDPYRMRRQPPCLHPRRCPTER